MKIKNYNLALSLKNQQKNTASRNSVIIWYFSKTKFICYDSDPETICSLCVQTNIVFENEEPNITTFMKIKNLNLALTLKNPTQNKHRIQKQCDCLVLFQTQYVLV